MDARSRSPARRSYQEFEPLSDWIREAGSDTLILTLPGFKKEDLKVQLDNNRNLKVSGQRPLDNNRWNRFYKEVHIPENCEINDIRASFDKGILSVSMPKTIPWVSVNEQTTPTKESSPSQNTSKIQDSEKDPTDAHKKPTPITPRDVTKEKATSTDAENQMNGSKGAVNVTTDETKKKEANGGLLKELGLDESRQRVVNVVVGLWVMLALLVYILQKITS